MGRLNKRTWGRLDQNAMYRDMNLSNNKCKNSQKSYIGLLISLKGTL